MALNGEAKTQGRAVLHNVIFKYSVSRLLMSFFWFVRDSPLLSPWASVSQPCNLIKYSLSICPDLNPSRAKLLWSALPCSACYRIRCTVMSCICNALTPQTCASNHSFICAFVGPSIYLSCFSETYSCLNTSMWVKWPVWFVRRVLSINIKLS